jgi:hypothetical protein
VWRASRSHHVDEARANNAVVGLDDEPGASRVDSADLRDGPSPHADIRAVPWIAAAVHDARAAYHEIEWGTLRTDWRGDCDRKQCEEGKSNVAAHWQEFRRWDGFDAAGDGILRFA